MPALHDIRQGKSEHIPNPSTKQLHTSLPKRHLRPIPTLHIQLHVLHELLDRILILDLAIRQKQSDKRVTHPEKR
jgi:hypothetical protein